MNTTLIEEKICRGEYDDLLSDIYRDADKLAYQKVRYQKAVRSFEENFGREEIMIFSAPGRSEIGGNHTDHQQGEVLAASVNLDTIGVAAKAKERLVTVLSEGYETITVSLDDLMPAAEEKGTTKALLKGILSKMQQEGYAIGGFKAYITSDVLIGAGLSSSAAYEILIGTILSGLYNEMAVSPIEIAMIGQYAENVYFGKPCGLMDQMACAVGGMVYIDFACPQKPVVESVEFDMNHYGYSLCITDTKGSHADLTEEYAAIPQEMKTVAAHFGKEVLRGLTMEELVEEMDKLRQKAGDRGVLRAVHFIMENARVKKQVKALKEQDLTAFLGLIKESGNSSFQYLQNVYSVHDLQHQNIALALALSEMLLQKNGVCRVHGGGFAGTIQAFVKNSEVNSYCNLMDKVFGAGACKMLKIRKYGGIKVIA